MELVLDEFCYLVRVRVRVRVRIGVGVGVRGSFMCSGSLAN